MLLVAALVNAMTAAHKNNSLRRGEHVFATDRAITVCGAFNAAVSVPYRYAQANHASLF